MLHVSEEDNPWFAVDLYREIRVHSVSITNRDIIGKLDFVNTNHEFQETKRQDVIVILK